MPAVMQESEEGKRVELLQLAARGMGGKDQLLAMLHEHFNLPLPAKVSYTRIVEALQEADREAEFCRSVFGRRNFDESWVWYKLSQGLRFFDMEDLRKLADHLSERGKKWAYAKTNKGAITRSIVDNATSHQFASCLNQLMSSDLLEPFVRQQGRWIVGPLGVTHSVQSRKPSHAEDFVRFIQTHFEDKHSDEFGKLAGWPVPISQIRALRDIGLRRLAYVQMVLTQCNDDMIFEVLNKMISQALLQIDSIERYWTLTVTPCGVFKEGFGAEENLARIITDSYSDSELAELLRAKGYEYADQGMGVQELCLSENPEQLLGELFGRKELNRIAREMGLVGVEKMRDSEGLVKIVALRLGFKLPPTLEGIRTFTKQLEKRRLQLSQYKITAAEREGLISESFVTVERILKDIACFHISFLWQETVEQHFELEDKKKAVNDVAKHELRVTKRKTLDRLMLGELISLLRELNEKAKTDSRMKQRLQDTFERDVVVSETLLAELDVVCSYRPYFVHDMAGRMDKNAPDRALCRKVLLDITKIAQAFADTEVYPCLLRINREVTDEYGRTYVEATDETGRPLVIKSGTWLRPQFAYLMRAPKGDVAVYPFIIEKLS